ncbi:MAG: ABC transporter ATP-binding protein [Candidatus Omnitrophica bacterium]|nr:ABC transporter ATP-binding protein [Candidatus Omnitrophota bacterium]
MSAAIGSRGKAASLYWRMVVRPHLRPVVLIMCLMMGTALLDVLTVGLTVPLLDAITHSERSGWSGFLLSLERALVRLGLPAGPNEVIFSILALVSAVFILRSLGHLLHKYYTTLIAIRLRWSMKGALFEKFLNARYEPMTRRARGVVVNDINVASEAVYLVIIALGHFFTGIFNTVLMVGFMLYLSWWATLFISLIGLGIFLVWRRYADARAAVYGRTIYDLHGVQAKVEVDAIDGLKVVKAFSIGERMLDFQRKLMTAEKRPSMKLVFLRQGPAFVNELLSCLVVLAFGGLVFLLPSLGIQFSTLVAFLMAIRRVAPALGDLNASSVEMNRTRRGIEVIQEVLNHLPQEPRKGQGVGPVEQIRIRDLTFAYAARPDHIVLDRFSATLRRGTVTAITGPTGAGKSTVANLLLGLFEPRSGFLEVNGTRLDELDLQAWRRKIGYVPQDTFVFNATFRENIALDDRIPLSEIEWAARVAQLHEFIASLPKGYDTIVGDRGLRLSGGQCQRMAIARAIVRHPEVLIFDEATSALDNLTEQAVYQAIRAFHEEAVVLVIAHRLSTIKEADQILVLREGAVSEQGTHQALMRQQGIYAGLYQEVPASG